MSGHSDSGKTTIASWIIRKLSEMGYSVVFIKNIPHDDLALDMKGKDTDRAFTAGASKVIGRTPTRSFTLERKFTTLSEILAREGEGSILVIEGFHSEMENTECILRLHVLPPDASGRDSGSELRTTVESRMDTKSPRALRWPDESEVFLETVVGYITG